MLKFNVNQPVCTLRDSHSSEMSVVISIGADTAING